MATYQDVITAMETSGAWVSSERTELASIYTEIGTGASSSQWTHYLSTNIAEATKIIQSISEPTYGKQPSALTDTEILEIRNEVLKTEDFRINWYFANLTAIGKIIEEIWDVAENQYHFALIDVDETAQLAVETAVLTYNTGSELSKVYPSVTACHGGNGDYSVILKPDFIPDIVVSGVRYGWYLTSDFNGMPLKAGTTIPLDRDGLNPWAKGELYAGITKEDVFVQMRTKQTINGAIQEFLVYPKTNGASDVVQVIYDETTMSAEDLGGAVKAVCDAGKIPAVAWSGVFYYSQSVTNEEGYFEAVLGDWGFNVTDGDLVSIGVEVMILQYTENDGWTLQHAFNEITGR